MFVKICGITNEEDALLATALGADAVGFVLAPSRRQVRPDEVCSIVRRLPHEVLTVGVFRNERPERVVELASRIGLHAVQLHGEEPVSEVRWIRERVRFVIRAYAAGDPALASAGASPADVVLVDSPDPGSGKVFDWRLAEGVPGGVRLLLAGGLTPDNVEEAIRRVRPWGVDVASGVEAAPGRKDPRKLRRFVEAARGAAEAERADLDLRLAAGDDDRDGASAGARRPFDWQVDD
ncbi:MAG: N-(5'-phosphoribosyl)anthranilate isomerase [Acidimicrobiia bacterium]|nr:MAG: N-(5'-phosphoribosyl)anthranilate isomerase [Acidimicrobiia bacterium]GIU90918.1 MAG: N-(5'-phosphoribosyl)anthranilate isomerase [Acidimicrobiia bacterium]